MIQKGKMDKLLNIEENSFPGKYVDAPEWKLTEERRLAIIGSRTFLDYKVLTIIMNTLFNPIHIVEIVSGGAPGADTLAGKFAEEKEIPLNEFKPKWNDLSHPDAVIKTNSRGEKYDALAGFRRNRLIVERADTILAFWNEKSKGTKNSINIARELKKDILIYNYDLDILYYDSTKIVIKDFIKNIRKDL